MADISFPFGPFGTLMKLVDLGDGTYGYPMVSIPMGNSSSSGSYRNIAGAATTVVKSGAGILKCLTINTPVSLGVITIYDNTTATGTKIATITNPLALLQGCQTLAYNVNFTVGLTIVTSLGDNITVCYV